MERRIAAGREARPHYSRRGGATIVACHGRGTRQRDPALLRGTWSRTPLLCIHGGGSTALAWSGYVEELSRLGRIITYDRRGCHRSERPERYLTTTVSEHADDSAALLEVLDAVPAVVIGRSLGGEIAVDLALRQPDHVVALVLLEPAIFTLDPDAEQWGRMLQTRFHEVLERDGMDAGAESFFRMVLSDAGVGCAARRSATDFRRQWSGSPCRNGRRMVPTRRGGPWPRPPAVSDCQR